MNQQEGWTALHLAASEGYVEIVELLLKEGCDVNLQAEVSEEQSLVWFLHFTLLILSFTTEGMDTSTTSVSVS